MRLLWKFGFAMLARVLGTLARYYAEWLFHQVDEGAELNFDLVSDLERFLRWFLRIVAHQFGGRNGPSYSRYDDDDEWEPALYGSR